jgi:phage-related tail fiber protein
LGEAKVAESIAEGTTLNITEMAVGDAEYTPSKGQTSLINEQWRDSLNSLEIDPENPSYVIAEAVIPTEDGGWDINEVGIFDSEGDLFAICKHPKTYKPTLPEGSAMDLTMRIIMQISSEAEVSLLIDPSVVLATRKYVDDSLNMSKYPAYSSTMTGDEIFTYAGGTDRKYFLDPNGADRNINPSGDFPVGFEAVVINNGGPYSIIFDSTESAQFITPGQIGRFIWNGTIWI